jgi:hypothetical protein
MKTSNKSPFSGDIILASLYVNSPKLTGSCAAVRVLADIEQ